MRTSEVRAGMTGYGLSVFRGTKIERFEVEVISVMRNQAGPAHDIVLIRCRGQGLEHSGAIEGMSGSPIYLTDDTGKSRMVGAFALGWENSKDPIAGVRPIEEMLRVPTTPTAVPTARQADDRHWNALPLLSPQADALPTPTASGDSQLKRLSLPLTVSGVNEMTFGKLLPSLRRMGMTPLQAGGVGHRENDPVAKLEPGAAIGLPIVTGDLDVSALGTVTEVIGDRVFAFGHEFNSEGAVDLPMGVGYVHSVIPSNSISFKIGTLMRLDGAIYSDESTAIAGRIGKSPQMIPVTVTVRTPQRPGEKTYRFQITKHPKFTPMGAVTAITSAITGDSALPTDFTVKYDMQMAFDNGETVKLADVATSATRAEQLARDLNLPLTLALQNPFGRAYPSAITANFDVQANVTLDELQAAVTDKRVYKPGDTASIFLTTRSHGGDEATRDVTFTVPDDLPDGDYTLTVGDASRALADETRDSPYRYEARNLSEVFGLIREITQRPASRVYLRLATAGRSVSVGRTPLRGLPPSQVRVLTRPGRGDVLPFVPAVTKDLPWDSPISGAVDVAIKVSNSPDKATRTARSSTAIATSPVPIGD